MLHWDSIGLSNVFLAILALTNLVILFILYRRFGKK
jgi:high-affinity nickel permease